MVTASSITCDGVTDDGLAGQTSKLPENAGITCGHHADT